MSKQSNQTGFSFFLMFVVRAVFCACSALFVGVRRRRSRHEKNADFKIIISKHTTTRTINSYSIRHEQGSY
jgi:hypothetical protein